MRKRSGRARLLAGLCAGALLLIGSPPTARVAFAFQAATPAAKPAGPGKRRRGPLPPAGRPAAARPGERGVLENRLEAEERPPTADELRAISRKADQLLVTIASDTTAAPVLRARAVSALGNLPTAEGRRFLGRLLVEKRASEDAGDRLLLRRAAVAVGWQGGSMAAMDLGPLLEHSDPDVRVDTAVALGLCRLPAAMDLLRARLAKESDARVRTHLSRQLQSLERAMPTAIPARPPTPATPPPSVGAGSRSAF